MPPPGLELTFAVGPDGRPVVSPGQRCKIYPYPPAPHDVEANRGPRAWDSVYSRKQYNADRSPQYGYAPASVHLPSADEANPTSPRA